MESQTQTADLQTTLAAILASIQNIRDENKTSIQNIQSNIQSDVYKRQRLITSGLS